MKKQIVLLFILICLLSVNCGTTKKMTKYKNEDDKPYWMKKQMKVIINNK